MQYSAHLALLRRRFSRFKSPYSSHDVRALAESRNGRTVRPTISKKISYRGCNPVQKKNGDGIGARDDALHLSRRRLSLFRPSGTRPPSPLSPWHGAHADGSLHFALALLLQVLGPLSFARCGVTMPSHSWALLPVLLLLSLLLPVAAEWRMEKQRAGGASCYIECRIRGKLHSLPLPPSGPPIVAFIPPLHFPSAFPKSFDLSIGGGGGYPRKPVDDIKSSLSETSVVSIALSICRTMNTLITRAVPELFIKMNYLQKWKY